MWLADSLQNAESRLRRARNTDEGLKVSDFDSKLVDQLSYYVLGYLAGLGLSKRMTQRSARARRRSTHDRRTRMPLARGLSYTHQAIDSRYAGGLDPALRYLERTVELNPDLAESSNARKSIANIQKSLYQAGAR
jgi:hypothetical protein